MLAHELAKTDKPFVIVEENEQRIRDAESVNYLVVLGNATEEETLQRAGIDRAKVLATVLSDDAANLYITLTARELNPQLEIIARGESSAAEKKLLRCGANKVVMPAAIGASRLAHMITRPAAESLLADIEVQAELNDELAQIGLTLDELRISASSPLNGHRVADIEIQGNRGFLIVAVRQSDGQVILNPPGDAPLQAGDVVIVLGHHDDLPQLAKRYVLSKEMIYRGARIQ
jgi:voltage-gated potassium channel